MTPSCADVSSSGTGSGTTSLRVYLSDELLVLPHPIRTTAAMKVMATRLKGNPFMMSSPLDCG
jgi:hypothetical protein